MAEAGTLGEKAAGGSDGLNPNVIFNLSRAVVMVVDDNLFSMKLTTQILLGFGIQTRHRCATVEDARKILQTASIDLIIVDCDMPGADGYDLVTWLRRANVDSSWTPIVMLSGHTRQSQVVKARDCGANYIIARPLTPAVLLERILWVARDTRRMLMAGDYYGPDRRVREQGPPEGQPERRRDVLRAMAAAEARAAEAARVAADEDQADTGPEDGRVAV